MSVLRLLLPQIILIQASKSVPPGSYALTILTHDVYFDQYRVDVLPDETVEVRPYPPGTPFEPPAPVKVAHPITFTPRHVYDYYTPPPNFNIAGMLSSPMVLIMIAGGAMMLATPYLMNQIDMEEFQKENPKLAEAMNRRDIRGRFITHPSLDAMMNEPVQNTQGSTSTPSASKAKGKGKKR
ncbi:hypothetical protein DL96DRAFT_1549905 [Flagelloscypha sp. PMI_526]|nr:hypothetical protein DL96DRAFT_1549905 [Flagelloscypha sp. PMI_526]